MAFLFTPRFSYQPVRCARPARHEFAPLFSLFDDAARELQQAHCAARKQHQQQQQQRVIVVPRFDVKETEESYVLEGEVPGFKEEDLSIEWNDNVLAVRGRQETKTQSNNSTTETAQAAVHDDSKSETSSVKSHQPTVEDDDDEDEQGSTATKSTTPAAQAVTKAYVAEAPTKPQVQHLVSERRLGEFTRQFSFPSQGVDHEGIRASLQLGVLKIVVPKAQKPASRRINIE